jgi:hypothetical protein
MPKQTVRLGRSSRVPAGAARDMALDIVSYGRRGPSGTLHFGAGEIVQIQRTVGHTPEVMVKVSGGGRDVGGVDAHLRYIGRHGKLPMETDEGLTLQGRGAAKEIATDWQLDLCKGAGVASATAAASRFFMLSEMMGWVGYRLRRAPMHRPIA